MSLHVTPEMIEHAYELLRKVRPFNKWKLPPADEVEFHVTGHRDRYGDCSTTETGGYRIRISPYKHAQGLPEILNTVAHEMIHIYCDMRWPKEDAHGPGFQRCADRVCKLNGFPRLGF